MSASVVMFLGPSLPVAEARKLLPRADFRGPARQGDVLRALHDGAAAIALIDGVFESQPSVWHQELRIALAEGVRLFGASSMGALRAAELHTLGMVGIGRVFEAYVAGTCVDDADVALLHAAQEHDWRPLTLPFVNVLAAAERAVAEKVLTRKAARELVERARDLHYKVRHWPDVLAATTWSAESKKAFETWRRAHPTDVKADDARACLKHVAGLGKIVRAPRQRWTSPSNWARRAWLESQGIPPDSDTTDGLRTALIASLARSHGLVADPSRVAHFERRASGLDAGLRRRFAEDLALEELALAHPERLFTQSPLEGEAGWIARLKGDSRRS